MTPPKRSGKKRGPGNHVAEWYGHRVFPIVAATDNSLNDQQHGRCPFLSTITGEKHDCVKAERSSGVCTISSVSNGPRQDWLVCPFRALDLDVLDDAARRLFGHPTGTSLNLVAAPVLENQEQANQFRSAVRQGIPSLVYFQNKLGGEISLSATDRSPEFSFDATMVEIKWEPDGSLALGRYGIFEIQTMDFHGTYAAAVRNLKDALRLHKQDFSEAVEQHSEWVSEKVEGPNIANVFKRTFYQMMFKFQIGAHGRSAGCVFAVPSAVWDSWQRHLGKPELVQQTDGTYRLARAGQELAVNPTSWIYVFELDLSATTTPNEIQLVKVIGTDAAALSHYALDVAPAAALEEGASADRLLGSIRARLALYLPEFKPSRTK
ncbi:hypothetical protein [Actinomadura monticuli]|uniref:Restriction endonuclease type II NotI domain-containing protein n=1 Tax=Actinomadura monticuli TaxID=3097367 RepID=A0ABV4QMZ0_9ACTN